MKINIIGSILGTTGYDIHTRGLFNALYKFADVKLSTNLISGWERLVNDAELDAIMKVSKENDINLIITTPHNWKLFLGTGDNYVYLIWEGSNIPKSYLLECLNLKIKGILCASQHTIDAILNTISELSEEESKLFMEKII